MPRLIHSSRTRLALSVASAALLLGLYACALQRGSAAAAGTPSPGAAPAAVPAATEGGLSTAAAAPVSAPAHDYSMMVGTFPELARLPAPAWVKPGLRLTYYAASATVAGRGPIFQLDPNGNIYATDGSGKRYSARSTSREEGASGQGYAEFNVVAVSPDSVALAVDTYILPAGAPGPMLSAHSAFVGAPGSAGDLWVNPDWLKRLQSNATIKVYHTPYKLGEVTHPAVAIATGSGSMVYVYDEATGVLLHHGGSAEGEKGINLNLNGQSVPNDPSRMINWGILLGQRTPNMPWANQKAPDWVARIHGLHFAGQVRVLLPGSPNLPLSVSLNLNAVARGDGWVRFQAVQTTGGVMGAPPATANFEWMAGTDQLAAVWIAPDALAALQPGQTLDNDPVTKVVTSVGKPGKSPGGGEMVVISHVGPGQRIDCGYDKRTGMLVFIGQQDRVGPATMAASLSLRSSE